MGLAVPGGSLEGSPGAPGANTQFSNYGMAYVTFDAGATWKGPVKTMTASGGASPQLNVVVNPKLVPLYPTAS